MNNDIGFLAHNNPDDKVEESFSSISYSQEGEDILLARIFYGKQQGFYVDVGAHHPLRFSNTYYFYKLGWCGINIDAMPGSVELFNKLRPKDINLELAISDMNETLTYYQFNESALNTFSKQLADEYNKMERYNISNVVELKTRTLSEILELYASDNNQIDFLSIDVEGLEMKVLKSNRWERFKPTVVLVEYLNYDFDTFTNTELYKYMHSLNYNFFAKTFNTIFFMANK